MSKRAFSLIELIIVVVIMGVVYTLAITSFQDIGEKTELTKLENLKTYLKKTPFEKSIELLCLDNCLNCNILVDNAEYNSTTAFDNIINSSIKTYSYDFDLGVQSLENRVYFNQEGKQENICFSYKIDKNGVGDQVIIKLNNKIYDFTSFSKEAAIYDSVEDLQQAKEIMYQEVLK